MGQAFLFETCLTTAPYLSILMTQVKQVKLVNFFTPKFYYLVNEH